MKQGVGCLRRCADSLNERLQAMRWFGAPANKSVYKSPRRLLKFVHYKSWHTETNGPRLATLDARKLVPVDLQVGAAAPGIADEKGNDELFVLRADANSPFIVVPMIVPSATFKACTSFLACAHRNDFRSNCAYCPAVPLGASFGGGAGLVSGWFLACMSRTCLSSFSL